MKINVHAGHNPDGKIACGAIGLIKESTEARKVKDEVIRLLKADGNIVYDCTCDNGTGQSNVLTNIVSKCNSNKVDIDVSIHFNSGSGDKKGNGQTTGTEVFIYSASSKAKETAERVTKEIAALGFKDRGVKYSTSLYFLRTTFAPAMLIECCFVDDPDDVARYDYQSMARAIAKGIVGHEIKDHAPAMEDAESKAKGSETPTGDNKAIYRVQVGAYANKYNAIKLQQRLKDAGFDAYIAQ